MFSVITIYSVLRSFGLFEGMSAIEMMDPKMDAGMMCNQTKRKVLNLQQSIEVCQYVISDLERNSLRLGRGSGSLA